MTHADVSALVYGTVLFIGHADHTQVHVDLNIGGVHRPIVLSFVFVLFWLSLVFTMRLEH
jgi:hypothetical protein